MKRVLPPFRLVLLVAFVLLGAACEYTEVNGIGTRTPDEIAPPQNDLVDFAGCQRAALGQWQAIGSIVNNSTKVSSYELTVGFYAGETRLAQRSQWIRDLKPGEEALVNGSWWVGENADAVTSCQVITINRFG